MKFQFNFFISILSIIIFLSFSFKEAYTQDLIITKDKDSIHCKIKNLDSDFIYFLANQNDPYPTLLPLTSIINYQYGYYTDSNLNYENVPYKEYKKIRFNINGGYSYRTASISDNVNSDFKDYLNELKSGIQFGGSACYFVSDVSGIGITYHLFKTSNEIGVYVEDMDGNITYGLMKDDIKVLFIGPSYFSRIITDNKLNSWIFGFSIGYVKYDNDARLIDNFKITSSSVGFEMDIGYDLGLNENISMGFRLSYFASTLSSITMDDGDSKETINLNEDQKESLNRIDFSIGLSVTP